MAQGAAECDKQRVPQKETRPETMKSPLVSAQNALILFKSPPFFIVRREKKSEDERRFCIVHDELLFGKKEKAVSNKKARGLLDPRAFSLCKFMVFSPLAQRFSP